MFNQTLFNPACAGNVDNRISTSLLIRKQWAGYDNTPQVQSFNIHSPFNNKRNGIGFQAFHSSTAFVNTLEVSASYAYRILFAHGYFSMGINAGISQTGFRVNDSDIKDADDITIANHTYNSLRPVISSGIYYQYRNFYIGGSVRNILPQRIKVDGYNLPTRASNFYLNAGYKFNISDKVKLIVSGLLKYTDHFVPQTDITFHFIYNNLLWVGSSYRTNTIMSLQGGVKINEVFKKIGQEAKIGYAFDLYSNISKPSHEIILIIDFETHKTPEKILKQKVQLSPFFL